MSEKLHKYLVDKGDYSKSYDNFQMQFGNPDSQKRLYNFMSDGGDYTKSLTEFTNQFFAAGGISPGFQEDDGQENWFNQTWFGRGMAAASTTGEATDLLMEGGIDGNFSNVDMKTIKEFIEAKEGEARAHVPSERMSKFSKQYEKEGKTWSAFFRGLKKDPALMAELFVQSLGTQIGTFVDSDEAKAATAVGAGTGAAAGSWLGWGAVGTGIAGAMGGLATSMESALTFGELIEEELKKEGKEFTDKNIKALLEGPKGKSIRNRSIGRGLTIGAVEGFTAGMAGKATTAVMRTGKTVGRTKKVMAGAAGIGVEAVGGGTGEVLGRVAASQEMDPAEIGFEAITGTTTAPLTVGNALLSYKKPTYRLNGEEVSYNEMKTFVNEADELDVAKANIKMENDITGLEAKAYKKQQAAIINSQIDSKITDKKDRQKLIDLDIKRRNAIIDTKKEGTQAVPDAEKILEDIESEISEIIGKYEGAIDKATTQEAGDVRTALRDATLAETIDFLQKNKKYVGKEVIIANDDIDTKIAYDKAVAEYNAKIESGEIKGNKITQEYSSSDGFVVGDVIVINKDIAGRSGQINVGAHELLHAVIGKHMKSLVETDADGNIIDDSNLRNFISDFQKALTKEQFDYIKTEIDRRNTAGENLPLDTTEEWLTIFSDGITKKEISFGNESIKTKLKNFLQNIFRKFGYKKEFGSGAATYNFMKDYQKSIVAGGEISARAKRVTGGGVSAETTKASKSIISDVVGYRGRGTSTRGELVDDINDLQQGTTTKADFQKPEVFNPVFESLKTGGAVNNYIRSLNMSREKTQETIEAVTDRLINFDPAAKRKDGTVIGPRGLGEFIMANVGFGKLVAAKKLAIKGEKTKREKSIDTEEVMQLEDKPTTKKPGTSTVKTKLKQTKGRQLTNLADLDIESSPLIKATTKIELKKLIESNPKNLIEQIQNILIPDLVDIIRKEMGVIGEKDGKLNIPDTYYAYLADSYAKTISSMEIEKIRANYKNLFKKEKMGFADYKTKKSDKPSLKKDSNYRKEIFRNVTTKAEFTKYHTEGKKNKLIANQRNLALMRAEAEAVRTAENYIIENSENLNEVYAAELRNFIDSKTVEKQKQENKSFDSVKYSKTIGAAAFEIRDAVLTGKNVFDNNGNLLAPYKNIIKNKKDSKALGDFIWANINLLNPEKEFQFLRKTYDKLYESGYRGTAYEKNLIQTSIAAEKIYGKEALEVVLRKPTESDALPDMILKIHGVTMNIEAKMANAQYSSVTNSIVNDLMIISKQYSPEFMKILTELQKESQKGIKKAKKFLKSQGIVWDGIKSISTEGHNMLINNIDPDTGSSYFNGISATLPLPLKFISEIYNNKKHPVFLMQLMGRGLFSMGGDTFNLGIPALENGSDGFITLRAGSNSQKRVVTQADVDSKLVKSIYTDGTNIKKKGEKKTKRQIKTGMKSYSYRSIPGIPPVVLNKMKSNHNIENIASVMKLMDSENIANLKMSRSAKNKQTFNNAANFSRSANNETKGISVLDFDDTLATTKSLVKFTAPDGTIGTLNAEEYASQYQDLLEQGYKFDFSEFNKVVKGKLAPLFNKALKLQKKFGPENMFILTARPIEAQKAIFDFLKANGLNIPLKNISTLGNSTAEAKALWVAEKVGEGFNDFYFADDALQNTQAVKNMLNQFDVKSKVQQAKVKFSKSLLDDQFNDILKEVTGVESKKRFSDIKARKRGANKGKFRFFIPPSHEDFVGLLYNFIGKGKRGNEHRAFFEKVLVRPLNRAFREIDVARQSVANDYKALNKRFKDVKKKLSKKTPDGDYTYEDAIRVYLWNKHGYDVPGLNATDQMILSDLVKQDSRLQAYAENLNIISKQEKYVNPTDGWDSGDIRMDLNDATGRVGRAQHFSEFKENADIIFSKENLNKIEATYGKGVRSAIEDMLYRISTGVNRPKGQNAVVNKFMNYLNGSVGSVMFLNLRSALLQQMSIVNYINFADNNIFAAAKAFANQKQYWSDFAYIFNSDMLKQRRGGIRTDVNGAELAETISKSRFPMRTLIRELLQFGFKPTQIGDSIAIATGGASYYRNRVNKYIKQGLTKKEAETKAFTDFQDITQSTQQSARPDMVSQQQSSWKGKIILNFQNITSQYNRFGKKAFSDIYNRRITKPNSTQMQSDISNAARITFYFGIQNLIFYSLQTALFAMMFEDDPDEERWLKKKERVINGSIDSILRGSGIAGGIIATLKNMAIKFAEQRKVGYNPDESSVLQEALNFSPVVGIKSRKITNAEKTFNYNKKVIEEMETFDIDNPMWSAVTNYIEGTTNAPVNRLYNKTQNVRQALNNEHAAWQRFMMFWGWSQYNLNIQNKDVEEAKKKVKKKTSKKSKGKKKKDLHIIQY